MLYNKNWYIGWAGIILQGLLSGIKFQILLEIHFIVAITLFDNANNN
jgi:hypothetical protein